MFIKLNEDKTADKSRAETAQALVSQCTELQTEVGLYHRVLLSASKLNKNLKLNNLKIVCLPKGRLSLSTKIL